jgi:hypothetical protein
LKIVQAIKKNNGGKPWPPDEIAKAVSLSPKANKFYYMSAASRDFGLTEGTRDTDNISLTEFGRNIAYAESEAKELELKKQAFLSVEIFKSVLGHYNGSNLPEMQYLSNTLINTFHIPEDDHEEFSKLFKANCEYTRIDQEQIFDSKEKSPLKSKPEIVTMAETDDKTSLTCFVIMPFREKDASRSKGFFDEVLQKLITPAGKMAGFNVKTANRKGSDVIHSTIINDLLNAELVLADLTEHNPNVLFELGMRMAENKPVVLIRAEGTGQIFDVDNMLRVFDYNPNLWVSTIEKDLPKLAEFIKASWENKDSGQTYLNILKGQKNKE